MNATTSAISCAEQKRPSGTEAAISLRRFSFNSEVISVSTKPGAWPKYDWMGVAKAALESTSRYLARDLGAENIRVNLIAAGPIRTMAAKSIPGFEEFEKVWNERSPLFWDVTDPIPAAQATVALLSDWFPKTTAEIIHVDGGLHAMGA